MIVPVLHDKNQSQLAGGEAPAIKSVDLSPGKRKVARKVARQLVKRLEGVANMVNVDEITASWGEQLAELVMSDYRLEKSEFV